MRTRASLSNHRHARRHAPATIGLVISVLLCVAGYVLISSVFRPFPFRKSIFVEGDPGYIVSFTSGRDGVTVMDVPSDMVITGLYGYGAYRTGALAELDRIDKRHGRLILDSIADAFGLPVSWVARPVAYDGSTPETRVRSIFSWGSIVSGFGKGTGLNPSPFEWIAMVVAVRRLPQDRLTVLSSDSVITDATAADGGTVRLLDESKLDYVLSQSFVDADIRGEGRTVAIYNTTAIPSVGVRSARILTHTGIQTVFVGNTDSALERCRLSGNADALRSRTAAFIRSYFGCEDRKGGSDVGVGVGADLIVELGKTNGGRFQ